MADKKNLCAQIDIALHNRVTEEKDRLEMTTSQYIASLLTEYYKMKDENAGHLGWRSHDLRHHGKEALADRPLTWTRSGRAVVETACRLVGKVNYFWGGKSLVIGWDSRWGQLTKVWAAQQLQPPTHIDPMDWTAADLSIGYFTMSRMESTS